MERCVTEIVSVYLPLLLIFILFLPARIEGSEQGYFFCATNQHHQRSV
jgi:hypothetical protein